AELTSFIGREGEIAEVKRRLATARLLTLTGAGGTGKSRLALRVAADLAEDFADGVCFVGLAPIRDHDLVAPAIAKALDMPDAATSAQVAERLVISAVTVSTHLR